MSQVDQYGHRHKHLENIFATAMIAFESCSGSSGASSHYQHKWSPLHKSNELMKLFFARREIKPGGALFELSANERFELKRQLIGYAFNIRHWSMLKFNDLTMCRNSIKPPRTIVCATLSQLPCEIVPCSRSTDTRSLTQDRASNSSAVLYTFRTTL